ncbi:hypothetical protein E2C01_006917 [Portunus trituberculatus]|uniref:Uncharacterized protein n=1 Tax=Portunus trituberculatus TaxID=210409 RepID=A0A5B7CXK7_PORTR|nr:hypothetical protein [Portunus trituberculatus]
MWAARGSLLRGTGKSHLMLARLTSATGTRAGTVLCLAPNHQHHFPARHTQASLTTLRRTHSPTKCFQVLVPDPVIVTEVKDFIESKFRRRTLVTATEGCHNRTVKSGTREGSGVRCRMWVELTGYVSSPHLLTVKLVVLAVLPWYPSTGLLHLRHRRDSPSHNSDAVGWPGRVHTCPMCMNVSGAVICGGVATYLPHIASRHPQSNIFMSESANESERGLRIAPGNPTRQIKPHGPGISLLPSHPYMQDTAPGGERLGNGVC